MGRDYIKAFYKLGADNCGFLNVENRSQAADAAILKRLKDCDALFATGGDQLALTSTIGGTAFYFLLKEKLEDSDFIYAGTSAGAAASSEIMIIEGEVRKPRIKGR
ncbi:Type 1 glutamine amidotransferase-like domain-containing protein [Kaistella sp. PBT33-4]|uniref:Type 1 glutamine amidotransferase-like domain-containing protein n=1 Tax=Kaistella sp. PBT33-4 TaxID=3032000 RepID=UPI0023D89DE7|nr:Type 1 glutamine amidotransferase-like domain-containing protein [Kaistella sp. PBT33-4]MDF0720787.1 Type 1 glutamine amidotransferase-like domain-containing protein [Kaistella sp. PBT33-4]